MSYAPGGLNSISGFAIGSDWTVVSRAAEISELEMISHVAFWHTALGVLQGWKFSRMSGIPADRRGVAIGSLINAGFAATWVHATYPDK